MMETDHPDYERLMHDFGENLDAAAVRRAGLRRSHRRLTGGALVLAGIAAITLLLIGAGGGTRLDVVAQARAALIPTNEIVHLVTTMHVETRGGPDPGAGPASTEEQWSTSNPTRWRTATTIPTPTTTPKGKPAGNLDGLITGPMQFSYANGTEEEYYEQPNTLNVTSGYRDAGSKATPSGPLGVEPVAQVRTMLEGGRLKDAGSATVAGRVVRRLVGREPRGGNPPWPVEYDVDPDTYAPVRVTIQSVSPPHQSSGRAAPRIVLDVNTYALIPLNNSSAALLRIHTTGNPTVHHYQASDQ